MKYKSLIAIFPFIILPVSNIFAQEFYTSLNNYNDILINPSYAGYHYESNVWTSWSVFVKGKNDYFDEFNIVYDRYAPKLKGGTAFYLKQGLQSGINVNTLEAGFSFTPRIRRFNGKFLPSVYIGYNKPVKHWLVYTFDEWRNRFNIHHRNIPGKKYLRDDLYKIGGSLLFIGDNIRFGIFGTYGIQIHKDDKVLSSKYPYKVIAHFSTRIKRKSNGVLSRSKTISPQFILHYENGLLGGKSELRVTGRQFLYSAYLLDDFSDNIHQLGGSAGFISDALQFVFSCGFGSTTNLDRLAFNSSLSLIIFLPKENVKRTFPFSRLKF